MSGFKQDLTSIVGKGNVAVDAATLDAYGRDESFVLPIKPRGAVRPQNVEQVQSLVNWANETRTPLVPVSSGAPHFRGDTVPSATGTLMVDMSGMNKIIRINRRTRNAIFEPGVTYPQLQAALEKEGMRISIPLAPRNNKSVVGALLEREPTLIPRYQWLAFEPLRVVEVVWGNGEKFRTGDAGNWKTLEQGFANKQAPVGPGGPGQFDYWRLVSAAQGSMGIVTWASVKCELAPSVYKLFFVSAKKLDDLVNFVYKVLRIRFGDELLIMNNFQLAMVLGGKADTVKARAAELPAWSALITIAGRQYLPEERVAFQQQDIAEIAQQQGLKLVPEIAGARNAEVMKAVFSAADEPYWKLSYKGGCQNLFFLTTLDKTPGFVNTMMSLAEANQYSTSEIGVYVQPVHQGVATHLEFYLPYNPKNASETAKMRDLFTKASEEMLQKGAYYSRPYGIWANMAYNRDAQTTDVLKKLKGMFDPNNIMNPGKLCY
ncbi:MAG TPA: FAD-binding oxidoreductase [Dehalococcoidales bacterium]|nr:FAD-binding oxidoreductase [Dehalococcoidales bacterium]